MNVRTAERRAGDHLVADVLDALGLDKAAVVGTSRGGLDAVRSAAAHPDRVERLVLIGWCFGTPGSTAPLWLRAGAMPGAAGLAALVPATPGSVRATMRRAGLVRAVDEGHLTDLDVDWLVALYRDTDTLRNDMTAGAALISLLDRVWELGANMWSYDAAFVALAETLDTTLVTVDGKLEGVPGVVCPVRNLRQD